MNSRLEEYIGIYNNVYPEGYCKHMIEEFERLEEGGAGGNRLQIEGAPYTVKNDYAIGLNLRNHNAARFNDRDVCDIFFEGLQNCYDHYTTKFNMLRNDKVKATAVKMQRTSPGGGYHIWHCEQGNDTSASRVLVYMLYLNTLAPENCGETEFLYQQKRFNPEENTMILWPANYTHAHRGNPVYGEANKYVITGWFYYE